MTHTRGETVRREIPRFSADHIYDSPCEISTSTRVPYSIVHGASSAGTPHRHLPGSHTTPEPNPNANTIPNLNPKKTLDPNANTTPYPNPQTIPYPNPNTAADANIETVSTPFSTLSPTSIARVPYPLSQSQHYLPRILFDFKPQNFVLPGHF